MTSFSGTAGADNFSGTAGNDLFNFAVAALTAADTVSGGGGTDTLVLTTAGAVTAASLAHFTAIDAIRFTLAGTSLALDDVFAANNLPGVQITGTNGNDRIDASAATAPGFALNVTAFSGNDVIRGGAGNDTVRFAAPELTSGDLIAGGGGSDTLVLTTAGMIDPTSLTQVTGIEAITFSLGGTTLTVDDSVAGNFPSGLQVNGTTGNDTVDASAVTNTGFGLSVTASRGSDVILGGAGNDLARFAVTDLTAADVFLGGGGTDTLYLTGAGSVTAAALAGVIGIETITLGSGGISLAIDNAVAEANAAMLAVTGSSGNDVVDASAVTAAGHAIAVTLGAGNDAVGGSAGDDIVRIAAADLTASDLLAGNGGTDMLVVTVAGTVTAASLAGVSGFEAISFAVGGTALALNDGFANANAANFQFNGSAGNDSIDASAVTVTTRGIVAYANGGTDRIKGGAGADTAHFAATDIAATDVFAGGGGFDTLAIDTAGTITAARLAGISGIEALRFAVGGTRVFLDNGFATHNAASLTVDGSSGDDTIDASGVSTTTFGLNVDAGGGNDTIRGGVGKDIVAIAAIDLSASDIFAGGAGSDQLIITGAGAVSAAMLAGISGIETIQLAVPGVSLAIDDAVSAANAARLVITDSGGDDIVDASTLTTAGRAISVNAGGGNDMFTGGASNDVFRFAVADLDSNDRVIGGGGNDTLVLSTAGIVAPGAFFDVQVEAITFSQPGTTLELTSADLTQVPIVTINGTTGNDTVDLRFVRSASIFRVYANGGTDTILGGAGGIEAHFAAADITAADRLSDGVINSFSYGLVIDTAGTVTAASLVNFAGIAEIDLKQGGTSLTLDDVFAGQNATDLFFLGSSGSDTIDASMVTLSGKHISVKAGAGNDIIKGGAGDDIAMFDANQITAADTYAAGGGFDTLRITAPGTIAAASLVKFSGLDYIRFDAAGIGLTFGNNFAGQNADGLQFEGTDGNDRIDASAVTLAVKGMVVQAKGGNDTVLCGAGNDSIHLLASDLTAADTVAGGGGSDTLWFDLAGTIAVASLAGVSGIDVISLGRDGGTNNLTLDDAFAARNAASLQVIGSDGNDIVNGVALLAGHALAITAGYGTDNLATGAGDDSFSFQSQQLDASDSIAARDGFDTLVLTTAGTVAAASLGGVRGVEAITLSQAGNSVTLDDGFAGQNAARLRIDGSAGNDTLDASMVTQAGLEVYAGAGNDSIRGGTRGDVVHFAASELTAADSFAGGTNAQFSLPDTLYIDTPGTIAAASLSGMSGIEEIVLVQGGISITFDDGFFTANPVFIQIDGSTGNDVIDASAVTSLASGTIVIANGGADMVRGGAGSDALLIDAADISAADIFAAGAGTDALFVTAPGAVSAASLSGISGIEQLVFSFGGTAMTLNNGFAARNLGRIIFAGSDGNDTLDASAATLAGFAVTATLDSGNDSFRGGAGNDVVSIAAANLTAQDIIAGGAGLDTLVITGPGALGAAALAGVSGFETIQFAASGISFTVDNAVSGANAATLAFAGSAGDDIVDASTLTTAGRNIAVTAGSGTDIIRGGAGNDMVRIAAAELTVADLLAAGGGADTLVLTSALTITAADLANVSGFETISFVQGGTGLTLDDSFAAANAATLQINGTSGNDMVDASAVTLATRGISVSAGFGADSIRGGAGNDTARFSDITSADRFTAGGGSDTLIYDGAGTLTQADLVSFSGIETVRLLQYGSFIVPQAMVTSALNGTLSLIVSPGGGAIDASAVNAGTLVDFTGSAGTDSFFGSAVNNVFHFGAGQLGAGDTIHGVITSGASANRNTIAFTGGGTYDFTALTNVTNIDAITVDGGSYVMGAGVGVGTQRGLSFTDGGNGVDVLDISLLGFHVGVDMGGGSDTLIYQPSAAGATINIDGTLGAGDDLLRINARAVAFTTQPFTGGTGSDTIEIDYAGASSFAIGQNWTGFEVVKLVDATHTPKNLTFNASGSSNPGMIVSGLEAGDSYAIILGGGGGTANGGTGNDMLTTGSGADRLFGNDGDDSISFQPTDLVVDGGAGIDALLVSALVTGTLPVFDLTKADQTTGDSAAVAGFENVLLDPSQTGRLVISGTAGANRISGGAAGDIINGRGGADSIEGQAGADRISYYGTEASIASYAAGSATVETGDTLLLKAAATVTLLADGDETSGDSVLVDGFANADASALATGVTMSGRTDTASMLIGGAGADMLTARAPGATLIGRGGADRLVATSNAVNTSIVLYAGDFAAGETITGFASTLTLRAGLDLSVAAAGAITGIASIILDTHDPITDTNLLGAQTVVLRGDQLSGVSRLSANVVAGTADSVQIKLGGVSGLNLSDVALEHFDATDRFVITGSSAAEAITLNPGIRSIVNMGSGADQLHAGAGTDADPRSYAANSAIAGAAGDDVIDFGSAAKLVTLDGGADSDTLVGSFNDGLRHIFDLSLAGDQSSGDSVTVLNFENLDWSASNDVITATGGAAANILIGGGAGGNVLNGGAGDDVIDAGGGAELDTLTGGAGADIFRWRFDIDTLSPDRVTDFASIDDTLAFAAGAFTINGLEFDTLVDDTTGHANIRLADLVRYSATAIDDADQARNWVAAHPGQGAQAGMGQFLALQNAAGDTVLYHYTGGNLNSLHAIATLADVAPASVQLTDFLFV